MKNTYDISSVDQMDERSHYKIRPNLVWGQETGGPDNPFSSMQQTSVREIIENAVDMVLLGQADKIRVHIFKDRSVEVQDNGPGIPTGVKNGKSGPMILLGTLRSGKNFNSSTNVKSTGTNGLGGSAVCLFSKRFSIQIFQNGKLYELDFKNGSPGLYDGDGLDANFTPLEDLSYLRVSKDPRSAEEKKGWETGTKIKFWLNTSSYPTEYPYNNKEVTERLKSTAFLVDGVSIEVTDELDVVEDPVTGEKSCLHEVYKFPAGLSEMVEAYQIDKPIISKAVEISGKTSFIAKNVLITRDGKSEDEHKDIEREVPYDIVFTYGNGFEHTVKGFTNTVMQKLGGSHVKGFEMGLRTAFNERFDTMKGLITKNDELPKIDDFLEGLTAIVSVFIPEAPFTGQSKEMISSTAVQNAIKNAVAQDLREWIKSPENQDDLKKIANKVTSAAKNRRQAQRQRDIQRQKNELKQSTLPDGLLDCELSGTDEAELYICEGDSAKTSLKSARNSRINALLGVRGKIINAYSDKHSMSDVLKSKPVQEIIKALGAGVGNDFNIDNVRYGRVFFAVDADVDGNDIAVGLYALFWTLFKPMVEEGRLYKIETPLFSILASHGKEYTKHYARDEAEMRKICKKLDKSKSKYRVSRLKGLGEMEAEDLERTAINPETRVITQITAEDMIAVNAALNVAIGDDVDIRKKWIESSEVDEEDLK